MMIGKLKGLARDFDGSQIISVAVQSDFRESFDELKDKPVTVEIKRFRARRSLEANRYAWVLINAIAEKLQEKEPKHGWTPREVYRNAIREVPAACTVACIPSDQMEQYVKDWESLGLGFQAETFESKVAGCTDGFFWKGSHLYNTQQMSTLINILIQEAEQQGIPTISEKEVSKMLGYWKEAEDKKHG